MGSKGSKTTTSSSTSTTAPAQQAYDLYSQLLSRAQGVANTPYQAYSGELTAPVNAQQQQGISNINSAAGFAQPYITNAAGITQNALNTPLNTAQYMSPYTQQVVNATQAQFNNQNQQQQQQLTGNAIAQGALGGNRVGVAQANLANQQQLAQAPTIANLYNQGYTTALQTAQQQQQAQLYGAQNLGSLGIAGQNAALTGAGQQVNAGTLQQQTQQAADLANYQQFLQQQAYPFQTTQWLAGIGTGVGSQLGGTTTSNGSTTQPGQSWGSSILGGLTSGVGLLGSSGAFGSAGWLSALALQRGGAAQHRADGGAIGVAPATTPEPDDTLQAQQAQLLSGDRSAQMFPTGTPELPLPNGMQRTEGVSGVFHHVADISPATVQGLSVQGRENELLDLGPYSKPEIMQRIAQGEHPVAIVERSPEGVEVRAAVGTAQTAQAQLAAMHRTKSPRNTISVEDLSGVLSGRAQGRASGGGVGPIPYYGVDGYVPTQGVSYGHTNFPQPAAAPRPAGDDSSSGDMKNLSSLTGGLSKAFGSFTPMAEGGNYDYNMNHTALTGITGMVAGGARRGGRVAGFADGGVPAFAPNDPDPINFDSRWAGAPEKEPQYGPYTPQGVSFGDYYLSGATPAGVAPPADAAPAAAPTASPDESVPLPTPAPTQVAQPTGVALPPERPITGAEPSGLGAVQPTSATPTAGYAANIDTYGRATKAMESGGNYQSVGPTVTRKDGSQDHAYGAYGVMGSNIPQWTQEVLGQPMTPQQFLASPQAQDAVYRAKFGQLVNKYGPVGAAKAWFAGEGGMNNPNAKDVLGTTVASYGDKFARMAGLAPGQGDDGNLPPNAQLTEAQGLAPPTTAARPGMDWGSNNKLWPALIAAGFGMMSSRSPNMGVAIGEGGQAGMQQYGAELSREMQQRQLDMRAQQLQNQLEMQQREIALKELPYKGVMTAEQQANLSINKAKLLELQRQHELQLRTPVKIGQAHDGTELYAMPRANPNGGVDLYPIDPQTRQISPVPMGNPLSPAPNNFQQGPGAAPNNVEQFQTIQYNPDAGIVPNNNKLLQKPGGIDYSNTETVPPVIEKGMDVPEPSAVGGKDPRSIKTDAESYLQTGKLPPVRSGRSPVAVQQANYRNAVQNYANALAASRGVTPEQLATMWRQAPGMLRFVLGADGRATVSLGTAVRHLDTVAEYAKAWAANDVQTLNRLRSVVAREFGKDAATNLEAVGKIVGPEIVKAIGVAGAGTEGERSAVEKQFSTAASPAQIFGAITATQKLLAGQLEGKRRQAANAGVPETQFRSLIGERPYEILSNLEKGAQPAPIPAAPGAVATPKPMSPQDQQALSWAQANPNDPRAAAIKKRLGVP